jgi:hypothetical protein
VLLVLAHFRDVLLKLDGVQARHLKEPRVGFLIPRNVSRAGLVTIIASILRMVGNGSSTA